MNTRQMRNRITKLEEKMSPAEHNGMFTWEEFSSLFELWQDDQAEFQRRAARFDGAAHRAFLMKFSLDDARSGERI